MHDLVREIQDLFSKPIHGREWAKMLFWDILDFDRLNIPVPSDVLSQSYRVGASDSTLWAESGDIRVALFRCPRGDWNPDSLGQVAGAVALSWRRALLLFTDAAEVNWHLVVCVPRTEGQAGECRILRFIGGSKAPRVPNLLAGLSPSAPTAAGHALRSLWLTAEPLTDPTEGVMYGLPCWLRSRLRGSGFEDFVRQAGTHANLTRSEEVSLGQRIQAGDRNAWRDLVRHNIRLAIWGARRFAKSRLEFEDLVQHSLLGVMRAADRYDPSMEARFSTYAFHWMRQCCQRACETEATLVRIPVHHHRGLRDYRKRVDPSRLNQSAGFLNEDYERILSLMSLDCFEWGKTQVYGEASRDVDPAFMFTESVATDGICDAIESILSESSHRDRDVVYRRFGLNGRQESTLEEIGDHLGITRERVRQIESKQLQRLRELLPKRLPELGSDRFQKSEEGDSGQVDERDLPVRRHVINVIRSAGGEIQATQLSRALGIGRAQRIRVLSKMIADGLIEMSGEGRSTIYRVGAQADEEQRSAATTQSPRASLLLDDGGGKELRGTGRPAGTAQNGLP